MLDEHGDNLAAFFANDRRAAQIPRYLKALADHLNGEHRVAIDELDGLCRHIDHIKEVVAMQQSYAKVAGVSEQVALTDIIEDAIGALFPAENSPVAIVREFGCRPQIDIDRYKLLQILMNLLQNAKRACVEASVADKQIKITTAQHGDFVRIGVCDNGVGIAPENAARLFSFGFTTSKTGHGFGLHSSAIAAKQMDGSLSATSEGLGKGATFTLELPLHPPAPKGVPLAAPAVVHE
jgi:signal transduction histidine kinase